MKEPKAAEQHGPASQGDAMNTTDKTIRNGRTQTCSVPVIFHSRRADPLKLIGAATTTFSDRKVECAIRPR